MPANKWRVGSIEEVVTARELKFISLLEEPSRFIKSSNKLKIKRDEKYKDTFHLYIKEKKGFTYHPESYRHSIKVIQGNNEVYDLDYDFEIIMDNPDNRIDYVEKNYHNLRFEEVDSYQLRQFEAQKIIDSLDVDLELGIGVVQQVERVNFTNEGFARYIIKTKLDILRDKKPLDWKIAG